MSRDIFMANICIRVCFTENIYVKHGPKLSVFLFLTIADTIPEQPEQVPALLLIDMCLALIHDKKP